ncbi:MAG TPA: biotin/lipoyl-binding protein, partial [Pseudoalteromonas sp.]|nr:biotin/lipoyl-binding protein [Pseudoalteromonas sp.]
MKSRILLISTLSALLFVTLPALSANVVVQKITLERAKQQVQAVGNTEAIHSVMLYPAVGDKVTAVYFKPGDKVKKGDMLLELDSRRQKAALDEAKIKLADTQRVLERLQQSQAKGAVPKSDVDDAKTVVELAKVTLTQAQTELEDRKVIAPLNGIMGLTDV